MVQEIYNFQHIQAEQIARAKRKQALQEAFNDICQLIINSGKQAKAAEALRVVQVLVTPDISFTNGNVLQLNSTQDEPSMERAADVACYKAEVAKHEYLESRYPELMFMLQRLHGALINNQEQLFQEILKGVIFLGADINSFINGEQHHKLEREHPVLAEFPEAAYEKLRQELYETYVYPKQGRVKVLWEFASAMINGYTHGFVDWVEIIARPIDRELVDKYLAAALADGKVLSSNTHLAAFEMLCESGKIESISLFSQELARMGHSIAEFRQSPKPELLAAVLRSIKTNATVYVN